MGMVQVKPMPEEYLGDYQVHHRVTSVSVESPRGKSDRTSKVRPVTLYCTCITPPTLQMMVHYYGVTATRCHPLPPTMSRQRRLQHAVALRYALQCRHYADYQTCRDNRDNEDGNSTRA